MSYPKYKIQIAKPDYTDLEKKYILEAYDSGWISSKGPFINKFEEAFAEWLGINYAISCSNGTAALHLALLASDIPDYSSVYVTPNSYYACSNVLNYMTFQKVNDKDKSDYSLIVHNYGYFNKDSINCLIEDCSESIGTRYLGKLAGTFGKISTFSFYGNKTLTTGEGGMVCTNNPEYAYKTRHLKNQAMIEPYIHDEIGYNYRMTNIQAALGLAQLERIDELIEKKNNITAWYRENIDADKFLYPIKLEESEPILWMNVFKVDNQVKVRRYMDMNHIETRPGFNPEDNLVMFPSSSTLTEHEIKEVCKIANAYS